VRAHVLVERAREPREQVQLQLEQHRARKVPEVGDEGEEVGEVAAHVPLDDAHEVDQLLEDELLQRLLRVVHDREEHGKRARQVRDAAKAQVLEDIHQRGEHLGVLRRHLHVAQLLQQRVDRDFRVEVVRVRHEADGGQWVEQRVGRRLERPLAGHAAHAVRFELVVARQRRLRATCSLSCHVMHVM
jgi:hypothetical protein